VPQAVLDLAAGADPANHSKRQHFAHHAGVDGRLAELAVVLGFPVAPVYSRENLIENSDGMIFGDALFERVSKEHELIPRKGRLLPISGLRLTFGYVFYFR
jgi:hypothetical protein